MQKKNYPKRPSAAILKKWKSNSARESLKWSLGLFIIFLTIPLIFLSPRILEQVKIESFSKFHWRGSEIVRKSGIDISKALKIDSRNLELLSERVLQRTETDSGSYNLAGGLAEGVCYVIFRDSLPSYFFPDSLTKDQQNDIKQSLAAVETDRLLQEVGSKSFSTELLNHEYLLLLKKTGSEEKSTYGAIIVEKKALINSIIEKRYRASLMGSVGTLYLRFRGQNFGRLETKSNGTWQTYVGGYRDAPVKKWIRSEKWDGDKMLLFRGFGVEPFQELEFIFAATLVPFGNKQLIVLIDAVTILIALIFGGITIYRLWMKQIELSEQQRNFVSAVTHELKTPLTSIRMFSEMLHYNWIGKEAERRDCSHSILEESERLSRLVDNVLHISRLNTQRQEADIRCYPAGETLKYLAEKVRPQIDSSGFRMILKGQSRSNKNGGLNVRINRDNLLQIFINLTDNAIKFSNGSSEKTIVLGLKNNPERCSCLLYVRDYGPGIPGDQIEKIFDLFYRAENEITRNTSGTGIGLALARELAVRMGGNLVAENQKPGALFGIELTCY